MTSRCVPDVTQDSCSTPRLLPVPTVQRLCDFAEQTTSVFVVFSYLNLCNIYRVLMLKMVTSESQLLNVIGPNVVWDRDA